MKNHFLITILLLTASTMVLANEDNLNWSMFQGNAAHTGYVPIILKNKKFTKTASMVITDGSTLWIDDFKAVSDDKTLYIAHGNQLTAYAIEHFSTLWNRVFPEMANIQHPSLFNGEIYINSLYPYGSLRAYQAKNGEFVYETPCEESTISPTVEPVVDESGVYLTCGSSQGGLFHVESGNGDYIWQNLYSAYLAPYSTTLTQNKAFAYFDNGILIFDKETGIQSDQIEFPNYDFPFAYQVPYALFYDVSNNTVIANPNGNLIAYDLQTHKQKYSVGTRLVPMASFSNHVIYVIDATNNDLQARDAATGKLLWSWHSKARLISNVISTQDAVLVSSEKGTYAISLKTHKPIWDTPVSGQLLLTKTHLIISTMNSEIVGFKIS